MGIGAQKCQDTTPYRIGGFFPGVIGDRAVMMTTRPQSFFLLVSSLLKSISGKKSIWQQLISTITKIPPKRTEIQHPCGSFLATATNMSRFRCQRGAILLLCYCLNKDALGFGLDRDYFTSFTLSTRPSKKVTTTTSLPVLKWNDIADTLDLSSTRDLPISIDSVLDSSSKPDFSREHPTLFRERHGWCPYSERVWLAMELSNMTYDTVRIDNTGGPRPSYFGGQTPQMKWQDGRQQGESMDLVEEIDQQYAGGRYQSDSPQVQDMISRFRSTFPRARPSSRAAYLFQMNGEPLWKGVFEETLQKTDNHLVEHLDGPFFCGSDVTAADIAWAPFLERYRYQLPCLHQGLDPTDAYVYPNLARWYAAMDKVPVYVCRVKGDASSWRKVLNMAGFGNAGLPPDIESNIETIISKEEEEARECIDFSVWDAYAKDRDYVQSTPHREAAAIITRNRKAIIEDTLKQASSSAWKKASLPTSEEAIDAALHAMVSLLLDPTLIDNQLEESIETVQSLATFLDHRMCVPRDMGVMPAATIKRLAVDLRSQ